MSSTTGILIASADLALVRSIRAAINPPRAHQSHWDGEGEHGPVLTPTPRYMPRAVIHPTPRVAPPAPSAPLAPPAAAQSLPDSIRLDSFTSEQAEIQAALELRNEGGVSLPPPWKLGGGGVHTYQCDSGVNPRKVVKLQLSRIDTHTKGVLLDYFC